MLIVSGIEEITITGYRIACHNLGAESDQDASSFLTMWAGKRLTSGLLGCVRIGGGRARMRIICWKLGLCGYGQPQQSLRPAT